MIESKKTLSFAGWRDKINQRCSALDRRLIVRDQKNIIPFEIHFPKEGLRKMSIFLNVYRVNRNSQKLRNRLSENRRIPIFARLKIAIAINQMFEFYDFSIGRFLDL